MNDVADFRAAWQIAAPIVVEERPSRVVQEALDRLAKGVHSGLVKGSTVEAALKPYSVAVAQADQFESSPSHLTASAYRDRDRWLVNVSMGFASSVVAFDAKGRNLEVPPALTWSYRHRGPFHRIGSLILFNGESIQDAGIRYSYRLGWLRRTPKGYASVGWREGIWTYAEGGERHLRLDGAKTTLFTIDEPKSFFVANVERIFRRSEVWTASGSTVRRSALAYADGDLRAVDAWLLSHRGQRHKSGFTVPSERVMAEDIKRAKRLVSLNLDGLVLLFDLQEKNGKVVVRRVSRGKRV